jgi:L-malate glycosyltransferase
MKILIVGSESIHVSSYIKRLLELETELYLLAETKCYEDLVKEVVVIPFRTMDPVSIYRSYQKLSQMIAKLKPDVVHIHQINRMAYFVTRCCAAMNIPCVSTAWGSDVLLIPFQNRFYRYLSKKSLQRSAFVTADSQYMIDKMQEVAKAPEGKYVLLQYGIDPIGHGTKEKIVYSNRMHKSLYRIDQVIAYFKEFLQENSDWKLVIAGSGPDTDQLMQMAKETGHGDHIEFVGYTSTAENRAWYARSMIYISIPSSDGTAVSLLEAMSAGCIPVVPDLEVSREWIKNGENGVVEKSSSNPLLEALTLDIEKLRERNIKMIEERASRVKSMKKFRAFYAEAVKGSDA